MIYPGQLFGCLVILGSVLALCGMALFMLLDVIL